MTQAWSRVALPIFINLRLCPLREREVDVLMAQGAIHRGFISAAMVQGDTTKLIHDHSRDIQVRRIVPIR